MLHAYHPSNVDVSMATIDAKASAMNLQKMFDLLTVLQLTV
jgi:hypothetical protein